MSGFKWLCVNRPIKDLSPYKLHLGDKSLAEIEGSRDYAPLSAMINYNFIDILSLNNNALCLPATSDIRAYRKNPMYCSTDDCND